MQQQIKLIKAVEDTLEKVEVHGRENLDRMLGCIGMLGSVRNNLIKLEKELKQNAESGAGAQCDGQTEDTAGTV